MPLLRSIVVNIGWLSAAQFADYLLRAVIGILVARHLGVEQYGAFAPAMSLALMGAVFTDIGMRMTILRSGSSGAGDLRRVTAIASAGKGLLIILVYLALLGFALAVGLNGLEFTLIAILGAGVFLGTYSELFTAVLQAREHMALWGAVTVGFRLILLAAVIAVILVGGDAVGIGLAYAAANVIAALISLAIAAPGLRHIEAQPTSERDSLAILVRRALGFGSAAVLMALFLQADIVMIRLLLGEEAGRYYSGLYGVALRLLTLLYALPVVVQSAVMPRLYRYASDHAMLSRAYSVLLRWSLGVSAVISGVSVALAPSLVTLLFGEEYAPAAASFAVLAASLWLHQLNYVCGDVLYALDRQAWRAWALGIVVALNIALNFVMIPVWAAVGAASTTLIAELVLFILLFIALQRRFKLKSVRILVPPLALGSAAGLMTWSLSGIVHPYLLMVVGAVLAAAVIVVLIVLRYLNPGDILIQDTGRP
jgi:O-antigen/teichoic acid export membrane protein